MKTVDCCENTDNCCDLSPHSYVGIPSFNLRAALKAAFTYPRAAVDNNVSKGSQFPVIWGSGASISVICDCQDFVGKLTSAPSNKGAAPESMGTCAADHMLAYNKDLNS